MGKGFFVNWRFKHRNKSLPTVLDGVPLSQRDQQLLQDLKRKPYNVLERLLEAHKDKPQAVRIIKEAMRTHKDPSFKYAERISHN